jgi:hypothetical protein
MNAICERLIWAAGFIHAGIIAANIPLPGRLQVRKNLASAPAFIRQIFYVHWLYIVIIVGLFATLCFRFDKELAGATSLGRFLSGFIALFWLLRIILQLLYYDRETRRANRFLDFLYIASLTLMVIIFGVTALRLA